MIQVIKSDGSKAEFDIEKVKASIERTGAGSKLTEEVVGKISKKVMDGMTTREIYKMVFEELEQRSTCYACRYNLRSAILKLGPAGFKFEKYVAAVLRAYSYDAYVPDEEFEGSCVRHEVDVIAEKDGRKMMIEAKFRNKYRDSVNLKDTMATWARFLDLVDGAAVGKAPHLDEVWIVTNARFSDSAKQFGICKGMHLIGWGFPEERSFEGMVDFRSLYPITVLSEITDQELEAAAKNRMLLCREVADHEPEELQGKLGVSAKRATELIEQCSVVIDGDSAETEHAHESKK